MLNEVEISLNIWLPASCNENTTAPACASVCFRVSVRLAFTLVFTSIFPFPQTTTTLSTVAFLPNPKFKTGSTDDRKPRVGMSCCICCLPWCLRITFAPMPKLLPFAPCSFIFRKEAPPAPERGAWFW